MTGTLQEPHGALVERFGTPLYVYDLDEVTAARTELLGALPDGSVLYYALKANPHPDVARALRGDDGRVRAEISSSGELHAALEAGFDPAHCLYTGPGKTTTELGHALDLGVRTFSTDSVSDVRRVGRAATERAVTAGCVLRVNAVNTDTGGATTGIRMTGRPSQFGFDAESLPDALSGLRHVDGIRLTGLHFFPLSNAKDEANLVSEFRHTVAAAVRLADDLGLPLELLDLGGGFAAPYGTPGTRDSYPALRGELEAMLDAALPHWRTGSPLIAFESGRYLTACAGTLLLGVTNVKTGRGRTHVILDGGINAFGGMSGLGRLLPTHVEPAATTAPADAPTVTARLVGPLCTPGDVLSRDLPGPALRPDDVVTVPNTGAYGPTASLLAFLGRPAPAEIVLRGGDLVSATRIDYRRTPVEDAGTPAPARRSAQEPAP
ncbi:type III PLP-dependent enzyme [Streptomyces sp. b94]|uniref:type III PLP-dependent enzyme n=1 Tax=Streptomyces sp. b94 TaxID=1827634 RepID=UPI001B3624F7|nr:type III PLP-dependent enzyme [Streptomyces sp. b94]MBQ1097268.1 type III PLP-dependent enzyme [Streptomyces sp. b94]